ncbi:MAG: hypothetical protein JWP41_2408 [Ramlibacter sp.]|nr:hypothetical protein [Ramlibacter sp.]
MPTDTRQSPADAASVFATWGVTSAEATEDLFGGAVWWLGSGASLLVWTALALVLTG